MKGIFFDIDGTLTGTISGAKFKQHSQDVQVLPGVAEKLQAYEQQGWVMIGISNQGGCSAINETTNKPYKTVEQTIEEMFYTLDLLPQLEAIYFCPDFQGRYCYKVNKQGSVMFDNTENMILAPTDWGDDYKHILSEEASFRKPGAGMIKLAAKEFEIDLSASWWMTGDRPQDDQQCAVNAGITFVDAVAWRNGDLTVSDNLSFVL